MNSKNIFSIIQKRINYNKLQEMVDDYYCINMKEPYLFMNSETVEDMVKDLGFNKDGLHGVNIGGVCEQFQGYKLFCDNTLNYGEVELR